MSNGLEANFFDYINAKFKLSDKYNTFVYDLKNLVKPDSAVVSILESNGIAGFKFHIPETEQIKLESEITDHYTDLNTPFQDHIALKPMTITVSGLQGEYFYDLHPIENVVSTVSTSINLVKEYLPKLSTVVKGIKTTKVKNEQVNKTFLNNIIRDKNNLNAVELWALFQQLFKLKSAQTRAFLYFEALWKMRSRFTVETTWKRYDNMVIQSMTATRDKNADITEFNITFKQMNFTETESVSIKYQGRVNAQIQKKVSLGVANTEKVAVDSSYSEVINV